MIASDLYELFRADVSDAAQPYLWSDLEVYLYMNDAYRMFVRKTGGVEDFTSAAAQVPVVAGDPVGVLDAAVLRIVSAYRVSDNAPVSIFNNPSSAPPSVSTGPVGGMVIGAQRRAVRWTSIPAAADTVQLSVYRMPLGTISGPSSEFVDVEEDHHFHLLKWMRHLAYQKQDAETFDRAKSDENGAAFNDYCGFVKDELARLAHKPRTVAYGGI